MTLENQLANTLQFHVMMELFVPLIFVIQKLEHVSMNSLFLDNVPDHVQLIQIVHLGEFNKNLLITAKLLFVMLNLDLVQQPLFKMHNVFQNLFAHLLANHKHVKMFHAHMMQTTKSFATELQNLVMMEKYVLLIHVIQQLDNVLTNSFHLHNVLLHVTVILIVLLGELPINSLPLVNIQSAMLHLELAKQKFHVINNVLPKKSAKHCVHQLVLVKALLALEKKILL
jgi:hypothetical protein